MGCQDDGSCQCNDGFSGLDCLIKEEVCEDKKPKNFCKKQEKKGNCKKDAIAVKCMKTCGCPSTSPIPPNPNDISLLKEQIASLEAQIKIQDDKINSQDTLIAHNAENT